MISPLSKEAWDKKVIDLGGSILQGWAWGEFNQALGNKIHRFSDDNYVNLAIETALPFGKKFLYCPRGPLGEVKSALDELRRMDVDRNLIFARVEPHQAPQLPRAVKDIQPQNNWVLGLEKTEEELLIGMKPKTRYNINLAQRKGVTMRVGEQKDLLDVWKLFLETATRNKIRLHPQSYYFKMWDYLNPDHLKILLAEYQGKPLASMILTIFGDTAVYLHGGTSLAMKEAMAPYVLHWEAIKLAKSLGLKNYDFGGIAPHSEERHAWAGITRFKKGFGGFEVVYPGSFDLIYSPVWYNIYKQGRKLTKLIPNKNAV
ncbi:MAG: peptidoglycan bridge formation glycyltransferase FemA/FemB family protein [Candidatus Doudnabacteria bacterium]|nr:peptidoglycan bridge formation glycyltransferase FemA/FemB family protein [Candidatus Doudnabacteria bacterium]